MNWNEYLAKAYKALDTANLHFNVEGGTFEFDDDKDARQGATILGRLYGFDSVRQRGFDVVVSEPTATCRKMHGDLDEESCKVVKEDYNDKVAELINKFGTYSSVDEMDEDEEGGRRCFVLKDGTLLKTYDSETDSYEHDNAVNFLAGSGEETDGDDFFKKVYDAGWVKANLGMASIGLPSEPLTPEQYKALGDIIEAIIDSGEDTLDVSCDSSNSYVMFDLYEADTKYILQRIRRFYSTGSLDESLDEEVIEETSEYKIVKTHSNSYKTKNGVAVGRPIKKEIYQVYFRAQDFNPSVNRWMDRGWSLQLTDFKTLEDARAYIKKYGKELKDTVEERLNPLDFEQYKAKFEKYKAKYQNKSKEDLIKLYHKVRKEYEDCLNKEGQAAVPNPKKAQRLHNKSEELYCELTVLANLWQNKEDEERYGKNLEEDIEKHDELNPALFDGEELKPEIKDAIQKIVDTFVDDLKESDVDIKVKDVVLVGSNVSYNYTKDSDLDLHIIADSNGTDYPAEFATLLYSAYRSIFNRNYDITLKGVPVEVYVEMDNLGAAKSNGQYSLNSGWLKKPSKDSIPDVNLNQGEFERLFSEWEDKYFNLLDEIGVTPEEVLTLVEKEDEEASEKVKDFIEDIYELRKASIANEGEYGVGNLVFKEFRNLGYLDGLKSLRKVLKGKELSLENLKESVRLQKATPYMLRNDGELLTCGDIHPYIYYNIYDKDEKELAKLISGEDIDGFISWFYDNTSKPSTKKEISSLLYSILSCEDLNYLHNDAQHIVDKLSLKKTDEVTNDKEQILDIFNALNDDTNQEFCKVRVSSLKFGGSSNEVYFRISSINFNWFDLIWKVLMDNEAFVKDVTIVKDMQTFGGGYLPYIINGKKIEHMPVEDFLTLEGSPTVEKFEFSKDAMNESFDMLGKGKSMTEAYWYAHPRYAHMWYGKQVEDSLGWDMEHILNPSKCLKEDFSNDALESIYNSTLDNDGGTFSIKEGKSLSGTDSTKNVYSVEFKSKDWNKRIGQVDKQEVIDALKMLSTSEEAKDADAIGTWSSGKGERPQSSVGLDKFFKDREEAERFALEHKQRAIGVFDGKGNYSDTIYRKDFKYKKQKEDGK